MTADFLASVVLLFSGLQSAVLHSALVQREVSPGVLCQEKMKHGWENRGFAPYASRDVARRTHDRSNDGLTSADVIAAQERGITILGVSIFLLSLVLFCFVSLPDP